jgi:hypothetical protein
MKIHPSEIHKLISEEACENYRNVLRVKMAPLLNIGDVTKKRRRRGKNISPLQIPLYVPSLKNIST